MAANFSEVMNLLFIYDSKISMEKQSILSM